MADNTNIIAEAVDSVVDDLLTDNEPDTTTGEELTFEFDTLGEDAPVISEALVESVKSLGLPPDEIPSDLSPSAVAFLQKAIDKNNERVRGFQSGFDKTRVELGQKAQAYDAIVNHPSFPRFVESVRSGIATAPAAATEPELDLDSLPQDPMKRVEAVVNHYIEKALKDKLSGLDQKVNAVGARVLDSTWQAFVALHPDAPEYSAEIRRLIPAGFDLEGAYRMAKGASVKEEDIEARVIAQLKERISERKKVGGSLITENKSGVSRTSDDLVALAQAKGPDAAFLQAIAMAERENAR